ncbi:hypothetical protein EIP91_004366 [Steccherinum ochraceum]|uniref:Uncharacterized protein n=1 Tax=Steccherinum ochraceum TaxID=92696 RepID=A0A4V2MXH8_9APHY|nr:hypothetical protein EIP91_004366 [Steccherinum ochraceum]
MSSQLPISSVHSPAQAPRKRTMSFSSPHPAKAARTPLRRTGSFLSLDDMESATRADRAGSSSSLYVASSSSSSTPSTQARALRQYKEHRERRRNQSRASSSASSSSSESFLVIQSHPHPQQSVSKPQYSPPPTSTAFPCPRTSSPLSPARTLLPARASFPRSKREPDLYKVAITTRMRASPEGQKILHMGPRLALSIHAATKELERIVAAQTQSRDRDGDVAMVNVNEDGSGMGMGMTTSWIVVPPEDWEMVDCRA